MTQALPINVDDYRLGEPDGTLTPAIAVYPSIIQENLKQALRLAEGHADSLRPHVKTHKTIEITRLELSLGITKHKCATLAEAEMLASSGVRDVMIAYPLVGPNVPLLLELIPLFPDTTFSVLADSDSGLRALDEAARSFGTKIDVLLDLDGGMGRTGVHLGSEALALWKLAHELEGLRTIGVQLYDGNVEEPDPDARLDLVREEWHRLQSLLSSMAEMGSPVSRIVVAGTGTSYLWLRASGFDPRVEASPGTFVFSDWNYHHRFAEMGMKPSAVLLTRVISKPRSGRFTCDLGCKAVASDPLLERRVHFLELKETKIVRQSEEHLVVESPMADDLSIGRLLYALPYHICPSIPLHRELLVVENGRVCGAWQVAARDRTLRR